MAIELRVKAITPETNLVLGVTQITRFKYDFELEWLSGPAVKFADLRIRTFMYHHYSSRTGEQAFYGPDISTGASLIILDRGAAPDVVVSWEWNNWMNDVFPPRIDNVLAPTPPSPDVSVPDRFYKFSQEITLYPGAGTIDEISAATPTANTLNPIPYAGQIGETPSTNLKFGRFHDCEKSYSFLHPNDNGGSFITAPDNYVLEQKVASSLISAIIQVGSFVNVTTTTPHGFLVGEGVRIADVIVSPGLIYNGNFVIATVNTPTTFTYETKSYLIPQPGIGFVGHAEKWEVISGMVPSGAVGVNYTIPPVITVDDHTAYTSLIYAEKDTAIIQSGGTPVISQDWGTSQILPVQNYNLPVTQEKKAVWRFPLDTVIPSPLYISEINLYNFGANTGAVTFDLFQILNDSWSETNLATNSWPYINPLINENDLVSTYQYDSNVNQIDEFTYSKFDVATSTITDWVDGNKVPDVALVKRADSILEEYFFTSEDAISEPYIQTKPFIIIASSQAAVDETPPILYLTNTTSNLGIVNVSGDGAGTITYELVDTSTIQALDIINVHGTNLYDGTNLIVTGVTATDITVTITGNVDTTIINAGIMNTPSAVTASAEAVDNEEIDATPATINIDKTLALNPITPLNIVKNVASTMTFDFVLEDLDDGYYQAQVQDIASNLSPVLTDPILMEVSEWDGINPIIPSPAYVRTNDQILVTGFNVESFVSTFRYVAGDIADGGLNVAPSAISIGAPNLEPTLNGFRMLTPANQSKEFTIGVIDDSANTLTALNAPNMYIGLPVTFAYREIIQDPIEVGKTYYIESISYVTTTATITISETLGGAPLNLTPTIDVGQMYLYNKDTTLHVTKDGVDSADYNNIVRFNVDDFGPIITLPNITAPTANIQVLVTDPAGVDINTTTVTFGTITGSVDVNGDGTVYLFDVEVGPTPGTLRFTTRDVLGNERFAEGSIPIIGEPFIKVLTYDIISPTSFILHVQVVGNSVPFQIATGVGDPGVFVADSVNAPYGTISNLTDTAEGLEFDLVVTSVGDGVFTIWADNVQNTDTLTPIVITSISPPCIQTNDIITLNGANLGDPSMVSSISVGGGILITQTDTLYQVQITGTIEGTSNLILSVVIDGDNVTSNEVFFTLDNTPPVISIIGDEIITLEHNSGTYTDDGATAVDQIYGPVPVVSTGADLVDVSVIGTYIITYTANDTCGNIAESIRTVNVVTGCNLSIAISPAKGQIGNIVDIFAIGDTFNPIATDNVVTFNGILGNVVGGSLTVLHVQVPIGATTGPVQVETQDPECGISNPVDFIVFFDDEEFNTGTVLNTRDSRNATTQGNVSIFGFQSLRPAIYNRDYAYSDYTEVVDENSMIQNVASIVLTRQGERIMNPEFGTVLHTYVFSPIDDIVAFEETVINEIDRAVRIYESRVTIDKQQSIARFSPQSGELQVLLSLIVPPGVSRELGLTLSSITKVEL